MIVLAQWAILLPIYRAAPASQTPDVVLVEASLELYWWGRVGNSSTLRSVERAFKKDLPSGNIVSSLVCGSIQLLVKKDLLGELRVFYADTASSSWVPISPSGPEWGFGGPKAAWCSSSGAIILRSPLNDLWGCGSNSFGQLGRAQPLYIPLRSPRRLFTPILPSLLSSPKNGGGGFVVMGFDYTLFTAGPTVFGVGANSRMQLGLGHVLDIGDPVELVALTGKSLVSLHEGMAVTIDAEVYVWGLNGDGELCAGHQNSISVPTIVPNQPSALSGASLIVRSSRHTLIVDDTTGWLFGCGHNAAETRLLGISSAGTYVSPTRADLGVLATRLVKVAHTSASNTLVVLCNAKTYVWGENSNGQIPGAQLGMAQSTPVHVDALIASVLFALQLRSANNNSLPVGIGVSEYFGSVLVLPVTGSGPGISLSTDTGPTVNDGTLSFASGVVSPQWTWTVDDTLWNASYFFEEIDATGSIVVPAIAAPSTNWFLLPLSNGSFTMISVLDNCAIVAITVTVFENVTLVEFANRTIEYAPEQVKFSYLVSEWPYTASGNSVRWTVDLYTNSSDISFSRTSASEFDVFSLTSRSQGTTLTTRTFLRAVDLATSSVLPFSTSLNIQSGHHYFSLTFPASCISCLVDPDMSLAFSLESGAGLSRGAIVGVAIGAILFATAAGIGVVVLMKALLQDGDKKANAALRAKGLERDVADLKRVEKML